MVDGHFLFRRSNGSLLLLLAAALLLQPSNQACQTATAQSRTDDEMQLPAELQAKLDKLRADLKLAQAAGDRNAEAKSLNQIGELHFHVSNYQAALSDYNQVLALPRSSNDTQNVITALNGKGDIYLAMEDKRAAEMYEQALDLATASHNNDGAAMALSGLGWLSNKTGQSSEALRFYRRALPLAQSANDNSLLARLFHRLGVVYYELGMKHRALDYYIKALPIFRRLGDRDREATVLNEIGLVYYSNSDKRRALTYYNKALLIFRKIGDRNGEALSLKLIGRDNGALGMKQKALENLQKARDILREIGDRGNEAVTLSDMGDVYSSRGQQQPAMECYIQALSLATEVNDLLLQALIFHNMAHNQKDTQPALAIFYGKQAVKLLQEARGNNQSLSSELKHSFLASKVEYYHELADMLIAQGRLPEAQQILDLLKEQEYSDYVRGEVEDKPSPPTETPAEQQAEDDYQKSTANIVSLGEKWAELRKITSRTEEQKKQYQLLSDKLDAASKGLHDYYDRLYVLFGNNSAVNQQVADVDRNVAALKQTIAKMPNTVALYTMVTSDHYRVIVITAAVPVAREFAISDKELNAKISEFQQVLRNPAKDPKPLARELYKILIGPVKSDLDQAKLDQAKAQTLVWSLDGVLRYVPMAALYDGQHYMVENYNMVTITPSYIVHLSEKPEMSNLSAAAMGISSKYESNLPPLPAVKDELGDVVKDAQGQGAHGVFPGSILLNNTRVGLGSIIAACLAVGIPASEVVKFFTERAAGIFSGSWWIPLPNSNRKWRVSDHRWIRPQRCIH